MLQYTVLERGTRSTERGDLIIQHGVTKGRQDTQLVHYVRDPTKKHGADYTLYTLGETREIDETHQGPISIRRFNQLFVQCLTFLNNLK